MIPSLPASAKPLIAAFDGLRRGDVDRRVREALGLRPVEHLGVHLGGGDRHCGLRWHRSAVCCEVSCTCSAGSGCARSEYSARSELERPHGDAPTDPGRNTGHRRGSARAVPRPRRQRCRRRPGTARSSRRATTPSSSRATTTSPGSPSARTYLRDSDTHTSARGRAPRATTALEVDGRDQPGRGLVLPGAEGRGQAHHRPRRLLARGRGQRADAPFRRARNGPGRPPAPTGRVGGMRLLVLGGTRFLGRGVVDAALAAGDEVTTFTRGTSGEPPPGVEALHGDRNRPDGLDVAARPASGTPWSTPPASCPRWSAAAPRCWPTRSATTSSSPRQRVPGWPARADPADTPVHDCAPDAGQPDGEFDRGSSTGRSRSARSGRWTSTSPAGRRTCGPG